MDVKKEMSCKGRGGGGKRTGDQGARLRACLPARRPSCEAGEATPRTISGRSADNPPPPPVPNYLSPYSIRGSLSQRFFPMPTWLAA